MSTLVVGGDVLRIENLHAGYGALPVLRDVQLNLDRGQVLGILGRNGSGKSTFIKSIIGLLPRVSGKIEFLGSRIVGLPTHQIARMGVAYVPQGRGIFPKLTVIENLQTGTRATGGKFSDIPDQVFAYFPILKQRLKQFGGTMSGGEQQMLAIGRALCGRPKLLLMDEPSDGVQPSIVEMLGELIPTISRESGLAIILVEQNVDLALAASNRCMVMEKGSIVHEGPPSEFSDPKILKRFLAI
jgi:urea ABC transporter ATP-binding protein UrtE